MEYVVGVIIFIWIVWSIIAGIINRHKQKIRDKVAHELLDQTFDYDKEKSEILTVNKTLITSNSYKSQGSQDKASTYLVKAIFKRLPYNDRSQIIGNTSFNNENRCPACNGNLVERKSRFGTFLACSNYPKCHFIKKIK